jgi:ribosomal protein L37AE/L43A
MIHAFDCPQCKADVKTEHEYGAQTCQTCGHTFFTFSDAEKGTTVDPLPTPYAYFKREGDNA